MTVQVKLYVPQLSEELPIGILFIKNGRGLLFTVEEAKRVIVEAQELIDELERMQKGVKQLA